MDKHCRSDPRFDYRPTKDGKLTAPVSQRSDLRELFSSPVGRFLKFAAGIFVLVGIAHATGLA